MIRLYKRDSNYHVDCRVGERRLRGSLGTRDKAVASHLKSRLEIAVAEGPKSGGWGDLRKTLPTQTYTRFAGHSGLSRHVVPDWSSLVSIFWKHCQGRGLAPNTIKRYQHSIDRFTEYLADETLLEDITPFVIDGFKTRRKQQIAEAKNARNGTSLQLDLGVLHNIFSVAVERKLISRNPVKGIGKMESETTKPFTGEELARLWNACQTQEEQLIYLVFRWTGLRGSDVADLRWADVQILDGIIRRKTIKRGKIVEIPLQSELLSALESSPRTGNVIMLKNKSVNRGQIASRWCLINQRAKVENCTPHRFRATMAVDLLLKGATPYEVAKILGDTIQTVEKHYLSFVEPMKDRVRGMMQDISRGLEAK
jgi:integrase